VLALLSTVGVPSYPRLSCDRSQYGKELTGILALISGLAVDVDRKRTTVRRCLQPVGETRFPILHVQS
jgi:hypothetical protein